jgi:hypothetical protein
MYVRLPEAFGQKLRGAVVTHFGRRVVRSSPNASLATPPVDPSRFSEGGRHHLVPSVQAAAAITW